MTESQVAETTSTSTRWPDLSVAELAELAFSSSPADRQPIGTHDSRIAATWLTWAGFGADENNVRLFLDKFNSLV